MGIQNGTLSAIVKQDNAYDSAVWIHLEFHIVNAG
jgi:hypothetical protein